MCSILKEHVLNCMFSSWYPTFHHLTIKSITIPLPDDFVQYLLDDGPLVLPKGADVKLEKANVKDDDDSSSEDDEEDWKDAEQSEIAGPEFREVIRKISDALKKLNHKAFPKMNWTAPKDAAWISPNNTLKCSTPGEVILLLKSSDLMTYDLTSPFKFCVDASIPNPIYKKELVLRKWANLMSGMEFRCFVRESKLVAVCQRIINQYYDYLEDQKDNIGTEIHSFLNENVIQKFQNHNYVVDIYKNQEGDFWIIDFNPWGPMTNPLLFSWEELECMKVDEIEDRQSKILSPDGEVVGVFKLVDKSVTMQPSETLSYRMPQDFIDLRTGQDATKLVDFLRMRRQSQSDSSEDETWQLPNTNNSR